MHTNMRAPSHHPHREVRHLETIASGYKIGMDLEEHRRAIKSPPLEECILLFGAFRNGESTLET